MSELPIPADWQTIFLIDMGVLGALKLTHSFYATDFNGTDGTNYPEIELLSSSWKKRAAPVDFRALYNLAKAIEKITTQTKDYQRSVKDDLTQRGYR
jgi:hypothetical protein